MHAAPRVARNPPYPSDPSSGIAFHSSYERTPLTCSGKWKIAVSADQMGEPLG